MTLKSQSRRASSAVHFASSLFFFFFAILFTNHTPGKKKNPQLLLIQLSSFKLKGKKTSSMYTLCINVQENINIL